MATTYREGRVIVHEGAAPPDPAVETTVVQSVTVDDATGASADDDQPEHEDASVVTETAKKTVTLKAPAKKLPIGKHKR